MPVWHGRVSDVSSHLLLLLLQIEMALEKSAAAAQAQLQSWADVAEEAHYEFLGLFSRDGPIVSIFMSVLLRV